MRILMIALLVATPCIGLADEKVKPIEVGKPAPGFTLANHLNKPVELAKHVKAERWVLIAFYPKAMTPG